MKWPAVALLVALPAASMLALQDEPVAECRPALDSGVPEPPACLLEWVRPLASRILGGRFQELSEGKRARFSEALARAVAREYALDELLPRSELVVRRYREESDRILSRYSFEQLLGELEGKGVVVLEDFEDASLDGLPPDWKSRSWGEAEAIPYRVLEENGNRFLRAEDRGENVMLYREVRWDRRRYPYIGFRMRIRAVPEGADERHEERADSAAGLYLTYGRRLGLVPETVKFVWSGSLRAGTAFRRPGMGMPWTVVAGSGQADETRWRSFAFHTGEVYRKTFGGTAGDRPLGVGVLTDANGTKSFASADYDDIVALASADDPGAVEEILEIPAH